EDLEPGLDALLALLVGEVVDVALAIDVPRIDARRLDDPLPVELEADRFAVALRIATAAVRAALDLPAGLLERCVDPRVVEVVCVDDRDLDVLRDAGGLEC